MTAQRRSPAGTPDARLLAAARAGDQHAFARLVEPHRGALHAHCYRMLGSLQDAEDALQDALLRAWRGLGRFDGAHPLRPWLYAIATNVSLDALARGPKRVLPIDHGPPSAPEAGPGAPLTEVMWLDPYPDDALITAFASPDLFGRFGLPSELPAEAGPILEPAEEGK